MKLRILIISLVIPVVLALSGCGNKNPEGSSSVVEPPKDVQVTKDAKSGNSEVTPTPTSSE